MNKKEVFDAVNDQLVDYVSKHPDLVITKRHEGGEGVISGTDVYTFDYWTVDESNPTAVVAFKRQIKLDKKSIVINNDIRYDHNGTMKFLLAMIDARWKASAKLVAESAAAKREAELLDKVKELFRIGVGNVNNAD